MISNDIILIDATVTTIKQKDDSKSWNYPGLQKFELAFFVCLDLVRHELKTTGKISDLVATALDSLFVFQCFEFYRSDYPQLFEATVKLRRVLYEYNDKLRDDALSGGLGRENEDWVEYFRKAFSLLLTKKTE